MTRLSEQEVGDRAGVESAQVARLVDLGFLHPDGDGSFTTGDVRRARLVHGLERSGVPIDALATASERGDLSLAFLDLSVYERFSQLSDRTFRGVSDQSGIPLELLKVVREAIGFARPSDEDLIREDELLVVPLLELLSSRGVRPAVIERWLRVYGESLRRIAETEADWWHTDVEMPLLEGGMSEREMLDAQAAFGSQLTPLIERAHLAMYHAQQEHAWTDNLIRNVESTLDRAGLRRRIARPPAMCFLDITGYTRLTEEHGDEAAADLAVRLAGLVQQASERHGGKVVRWVGDGVMLHFREPGPAVEAALEMIEEIAGSGLPPAHVGLHAGSVVFQGGDYYGSTVNIAARIAEYARPGELLVSQEVVDRSDPRDVVFTPIGPIELKGLLEPIRLQAARRRDRPDEGSGPTGF